MAYIPIWIGRQVLIRFRYLDTVEASQSCFLMLFYHNSQLLRNFSRFFLVFFDKSRWIWSRLVKIGDKKICKKFWWLGCCCKIASEYDFSHTQIYNYLSKSKFQISNWNLKWRKFSDRWKNLSDHDVSVMTHLFPTFSPHT